MLSLGQMISRRTRVVDLDLRPVGDLHAVADRRRGLDDLHAALALQSLLDDLHVQQPQESAAESESQRLGVLRLMGEAGIVEAQLLDRLAQCLVVALPPGFGGGRGRVEVAEHHLLGLLVARQRRVCGIAVDGDRVADPDVIERLDRRDHVADLGVVEPLHLDRRGRVPAQLADGVGPAAAHHPDPVAHPQ
jgi:hypothetical protein